MTPAQYLQYCTPTTSLGVEMVLSGPVGDRYFPAMLYELNAAAGYGAGNTDTHWVKQEVGACC